eukprot:CAMPEP_0185200072 /NCGR_PEP_ID=MMETSP1140-20130426/46464_1 /TAXON_ID=298111 /ORGANISM="Pavlova sp., Strain CCMP459" /LENGTH=69 /DNA_ID=CAMNT_0027767379 /DNA_START=649 /DNA_END=858 /DNA_ORIENTATION=-
MLRCMRAWSYVDVHFEVLRQRAQELHAYAQADERGQTAVWDSGREADADHAGFSGHFNGLRPHHLELLK